MIRVSDDLWERAKEKAEERGETVSEVIRDRLERYAPAPKREGKHPGLSKVLFSVLQDADKSERVRFVLLGNLDGLPYVWAYPTDEPLAEDALAEYVAMAEYLRRAGDER